MTQLFKNLHISRLVWSVCRSLYFCKDRMLPVDVWKSIEKQNEQALAEAIVNHQLETRLMSRAR